MAFGDPTVNAFFFVLEDSDGVLYDAFWDIFPLADFHDSQVRYRLQDSSNDKWTYLTHKHNEGDSITEVNYNKLNNEADVNEEYLRLMAVHNEAIKKAFGDKESMPATGTQALSYLIKNATKEHNNKLSKK